MALEPGFVPEGWKRGDAIRIINGDFKYGQMAALMRVEISLGADCDVGSLIGMVQFHESELHRAKAWINWWNGDERNGA